MNIKELAKEIGVSIATISRVINNSGYVSEETRKKVVQAIEDYQYVPNAIARSLSTKDSRSIGVIIADIENEFFSAIISGINEVAEKNGYNIHFMGSGESIQSEHKFLETVEKQRLAGVIMTPISEEDNITRGKLIKMQENGVPVILVDRDITRAKFDGVFVDNIAGASDGVEELIKAGHSKIAIITGPDTSKPGKERLQGYIRAMNKAGLPISESYIVSGDFKIEKAYQCTEKLLQLEDPPTAVFTSNNLTTLGCLKYLTEKKMKIGQQISIVGFDDIETLKIIGYKLSVVARDAKQQGREAMSLMLKRLKEKEIPEAPVKMCVPYKVIMRGSEKKK